MYRKPDPDALAAREAVLADVLRAVERRLFWSRLEKVKDAFIFIFIFVVIVFALLGPWSIQFR